MADGAIIFSTDLDNRELERQLKQTTRKIESLNQSIYQKQREKMPLVEQAKQLGVELDVAKAKLFEMQNAPKGEFSTEQIKEQSAQVRGLQSEWNSINNRIETYDRNIQNSEIAIGVQTEKAGELSRRLAEAGDNSEKMEKAVKKADGSMSLFAKRVGSVVRSALIFTVITQALTKFRNWMGKVIKTNDEASAAMAKLKGALLTMVQPLLDVIIPAFVLLVNVLTRVATAVAHLMSMIFGKSVGQSKAAAEGLYEEANALEGVGGAAEDAGKSLAGFDEINKLSDGSVGGGGGAAASTDIAPDFDLGDANEGDLNRILELVQLIGAALLGWKIGSSLGLGLKGTLGLMLGIYSAIEFVKNLFDAWTNGVNWDNLLGMILSAAGLAAGLGIALGPVAAGISLIVTGLAMLITGFYDAATNGWNLQNLLLSIAGILATGLGIALITSSWIPLLVAGIAAVLLAFTVATGHGEELIDGLRTVLQGFIDFFAGIFTGDMERAMGGIEKIFDGLKTAVSAVIDGLRDTLLGFLDWLDEKTGGKLSGIIDFVKGLITGMTDSIKTTISGLIDAIQQIFGGLVKFVSGVFTQDWDAAWEGVQDIFKGVWNGVVALLEGAVNIIIKGVNWLIGQMNKISFDVPSWVPGIGGKTMGISIPLISEVEIPRLATGAVIPPNREFMAVLGDQKQGTNIEAPLDTIVQAVMLALARSGGGGQVIENVVNLDGEVIYRNQKRIAQNHGVSLVGGGL